MVYGALTIQEEIRQSTLPQKTLAALYNVSRLTVRKWQNRDSAEDGLHRLHTLHATLPKHRKSSRVTPFFDYPAEIRKVIYTTNPIESVNMGLRQVMKSRDSFPNDKALLKPYYFSLRNISKKWAMPIQNW